MISGNHYKDWAENVFPDLKRNIDMVKEPLHRTTLESEIPKENFIKIQPDPINPSSTPVNICGKNISEKHIDDNPNNDNELLWAENAVLKNAVGVSKNV